MNVLHATLWRTCRVLANPVRLRAFWHVIQHGETCVSPTAQTGHASHPHTTTVLRA